MASLIISCLALRVQWTLCFSEEWSQPCCCSLRPLYKPQGPATEMPRVGRPEAPAIGSRAGVGHVGLTRMTHGNGQLPVSLGEHWEDKFFMAWQRKALW